MEADDDYEQDIKADKIKQIHSQLNIQNLKQHASGLSNGFTKFQSNISPNRMEDVSSRQLYESSQANHLRSNTKDILEFDDEDSSYNSTQNNQLQYQ